MPVPGGSELAFHDLESAFPSSPAVMSAAFEASRAGILVHWVQRCAGEPPLVMVAAPRGHAIDPLIRDSRAFALSFIDPEDRLVIRRFAAGPTSGSLVDPLDGLDLVPSVSGSPILRRAVFALDCEVVRHVDLEADHEMFVGRVLAVSCPSRRPASPGSAG